MAKVAPRPESTQGGGSTVLEGEVLEFVQLFKAAPMSEVQADDNPQFHKAHDEATGKPARKRAVSAAGRMRGKVATLLGVEESEVRTSTRAVEADSKGQPKVYAYWLFLTAAGQEAVANAFPQEASDEAAA